MCTLFNKSAACGKKNPGAWVTWNGAKPDGFVFPTLTAPADFVWPFPIQQCIGKFCALNAFFNAGVDVSKAEFPNPFSSLQQVCNGVAGRKKSKWYFPKCDGPEAVGTFVFSAHNHCFSVIDGWCLDPDTRVKFPVPLADIAVIGVFKIDLTYRVIKR